LLDLDVHLASRFFQTVLDLEDYHLLERLDAEAQKEIGSPPIPVDLIGA
jgi:hypothetical protein